MADRKWYSAGWREKGQNGATRTGKRAALNLGIVSGDDAKGGKPVRRPELELYDSYYESRQYAGKMDWEQALKISAESDSYVPVRDRKPRIIYNLAAVISSRVAAKLVGKAGFPKLAVEDDPETEEFIRLVLKASRLQAHLAEPTRRMCNSGSVFVRFHVPVNEETGEGTLEIEHYLSKYCYPSFHPTGELAQVRIQYVWCDQNDLDERGKPREKWYRLDLGEMADTLYDNPLYKPNEEPVFQVVESVEHGLGYVQGEWFRTSKEKHHPDGYSLIEDILDVIDDINYSLSQSSQSISYNQEPLLTLKGLDQDSIELVQKSSNKALGLGRDGEANYLETTLTGVEKAKENRDELKLKMQDVTRLVLLDPEKMTAHAQSGKAMEVLHGPFVELIDELRPVFEEHLVNFVIKIVLTYMQMMGEGVDMGLMVPEKWAPKSMDITAKWPSVFPMTMEDLQKKLSVGLQASNASIISRETVLRWVAEDFGIEDIEEELAKINAQPVLNPFGTF